MGTYKVRVWNNNKEELETLELSYQDILDTAIKGEQVWGHDIAYAAINERLIALGIQPLDITADELFGVHIVDDEPLSLWDNAQAILIAAGVVAFLMGIIYLIWGHK